MHESQGGLSIALERIANEAEARTGTLDLSRLHLTNLPEEISKLKHLRVLSCFGTKLQDLTPLQGLASLQELNCSETQVRDLTSLQGLTSLQLLDCSRTQVQDLTPLQGLASLQQLNCSWGRVQDLTPLQKLVFLQKLDCSWTQVQDLTPLQGLDALQKLNCARTKVQDLTPIQGLAALQKLDCGRTKVQDLTPLQGLTSLQELNCSWTEVQDLAPLQGLPSLQELHCSGTEVQDLTPLQGLASLQELSCSHTQVQDLTPLQGLPLFQKLYCIATQVQDLTPLQGLTSLQELNCYLTQVQDLTPLQKIVSLQSLDCSRTQVQDLTPLQEIVSLHELIFWETQVQDLTPLQGLKSLQGLDCCQTRVLDLTPLQGLTSLQELDCSGTQVQDLNSLQGLTALQRVNCSRTQVQDLTPLQGLASLQELNCSRTQVQDLTPLQGLASLQQLDCSWTKVQDLTPLERLPSLKHLGCSGCRIDTVPDDFWSKPFNTVFLYQSRLPDIPAEVLSKGELDDCLASLRAHLADEQFGTVPVSDVKLIVLGNGRVGKTQICRKLRNDTYDSSIPSTHGIVVTSASLPDRDGGELARLHLWDFGGQDIYHGTHALFMRTSAIFLNVWATESESSEMEDHPRFSFRNHPLAYWLAYVRHLGGANCPVLVVQTRCDRPEDEARRLPVPEQAVDAFRYCKPLLHYSALNDRGRPALDDALRDAVRWLKGNEGANSIGAGRMRVQRRLEELRDADANVSFDQRQYQTLSQEHFNQICEEEGGVTMPQHLLEYLHNISLVFYRKGLFNDRIILDQGWALDAVYSVFHREKCYHYLLKQQGRFTRELLELLVWEKYSEEEQELFLSLMESCGVCFTHIKGNQFKENEYITPELLPDKSEIQTELSEKWDPQGHKEEALFHYELLHPGLVSSLVARIGSEAGVNGLYWKDGVCIWEKNTCSHALIEQQVGDGWRGTIRIQTQGGAAAVLLKQLHQLITEHQTSYGIRNSQIAVPRKSPETIILPRNDEQDPPTVMPKLEFVQQPINRGYYVSYAWGDKTTEGLEREKIVDRLCAAAESTGIKIIRDKDVLGLGERITKFMERLGEGQRVFVILSDKYLQSSYCMFELSQVWDNCRRKPEEFLERVRVYTLPCAKIFSWEDRIKYAVLWRERYKVLEDASREHGPEILGEAGFREFVRMKRFASDVSDILSVLTDVVQPRDFEELQRYGLSDLGPVQQ